MDVEQQFVKLARAWAQQPGSDGGQQAIKGFNFQLLLLLKKIADAAENTPSNPLLFNTEELSDISSFLSDEIHITQAKYTLDSNGVSKALEELWQIYLLICREYPDLKERTHFYITGCQQKLKDLPGKLERWQPKSDKSQAAAAFIDNPEQLSQELTQFKSLIQPTLEPDSQVLLIHRLINNFGIQKPVKEVDSWLNKLNRAVVRGTTQAVCEDIYNELYDARSSWKEDKISLLWTEKDRPPESIEQETDPSKSVIIGQRATKKHLRDGRFAERKIYTEIYNQFLIWKDDAVEKARGRIPVFWLSGRSGCGKSVALLHLLSEIKRQTPDSTLVWCADDVNNLKAAKSWLPSLLKSDESEETNKGQNTFIAFDDPYSHRQYEKADNQISWLQKQFYNEDEDDEQGSGTPLILCCGPDEQLSWFEEEFSDQVDITTFSLPLENQEDYQELKTWYELRTGQVINSQGDAPDQQILVQTLFQWHQDDNLKDFAKKFKDRLNDKRRKFKSKTAFELVSEILYVNRLYAEFPSSAYEKYCDKDPELAEAMDTLIKENHHFSLDNEEGTIRFTHPHLANEIYKAWYSKERDSSKRKGHLKAWLKYGQNIDEDIQKILSPLWVIARLSRAGKTNIAAQRLNLIRQDLIETLPNIYKRQIKKEQARHLPAWVSIDQQLCLDLSPAPLCWLLSWVERADPTKPFWPESFLCVFNHTYGDISEPLIDKTVNYLISHTQHELWPVIWEKLRLTIPSKKLDFAANKWLKNNYESNNWHQIWEELWYTTSNILSKNHLQKLAYNWLISVSPDHFQWFLIWDQLLASEDKNLNELDQLALNWLKTALSDHHRWFYLYNHLINSTNINQDELNALTLNWLEEVPYHESWFYAWNYLLSNYKDKNLLHLIALRWLSATLPNHNDWFSVWRTLWENNDSNLSELTNTSLTWLRTVSLSNGNWFYIWEELWEKDYDTHPHLKKLIHYWLCEAPQDHPIWVVVWNTTWKVNQENASSIYELGINWLLKSPDHFSWHDLWFTLHKEYESDDKLIMLALDWLHQVNKQHVGWTKVWQTVWANRKAKDKSIALALEYLDMAPIRRCDWFNVWGELWHIIEDKASFQTLAINRLKKFYADSGYCPDTWERIWKNFSQHGETLPLAHIERGITWLQQDPIPNSSWHLVWCSIWDYAVLHQDDEIREQLAGIADRLLVDKPLKTEKIKEQILSRLQGDT